MKNVAERLHDSYKVQTEVEDTIWEAFEKYEPEIYHKLEFSIGSDQYDNSIEIYIKNLIPYPYEPSWEIRDIILSLGFSIIYWNFADQNGKFTEEIRGEEPRRFKHAEERYDTNWMKEFYQKWNTHF
jgi:hypothetical protein